MPGKSWGEDEERLATFVAGDVTDPEVLQAEFPDRSFNAIRLKVAEIRKARGPENRTATLVADPHAKPDFGEPPKEPLDIMGQLDRVVRRLDTYGTEEDKDYARVVIETDRPIALMDCADWHFGGLDVDYRAFRTHVQFLLNEPGFYMQLVGDAGNFMNIHRNAATRRDILTYDEQIEFLHNFIHQTVERGKLISVHSGNHDDEFIEKVAGFSLMKFLSKGKVPYFRGHGYVDLTLRMSDGTETVYPMGVTHKTRFHSFMNPLHGNKRMQQMSVEFFGNRPTPCVFVTAHTHYPAMATEGLLPEDRIIYVKCGTFKTDCTYSQRYFGQGRIGVPTIVFHPDRKEHVGFPTPWEAYRYMTGHDWEDAS